jgi:8-oxo-dGTP pyrophosphatase MutT (NUDIX family)
MTPISMSDARSRLLAYAHGRIPAERLMKKAAVAAVLREQGESSSLDVLMIRRAEHPRDPWSGHMAFPGGRVDPEDKDPFSAAVRETQEEIGLDLGRHASRLGELSHQIAMAHGKPLPMIVVPFVFGLSGTPDLVLRRDEVEEAVWVPLEFLLARENRQVFEKDIAGVRMKLPCYRYEGRVIWGLTLRMLDELMRVVALERY